MQVEPGESDILDVVPFLEMVEVRCDEGFINGVLNPARGLFVGRRHDLDEAMRWDVLEKPALLSNESERCAWFRSPP